jgi:hypothetical protein
MPLLLHAGDKGCHTKQISSLSESLDPRTEESNEGNRHGGKAADPFYIGL